MLFEISSLLESFVIVLLWC